MRLITKPAQPDLLTDDLAAGQMLPESGPELSAAASMATPVQVGGLNQVLFLTELGDTAAISMNDIHQGQMGDCFLLACLCDLAATHPDVIKSIIHQNADGTETVTLYQSAYSTTPIPGQTAFKPFAITVDNIFPSYSVNSGAGQAQVGSQKEIWAQVLEKAIATASGGYGSIMYGGNPATVMEQLIGQTAIPYSPADLSVDILKSCAGRGDLITFGTFGRSDLGYNLVDSHAYAFVGVVDTVNGPAVQLKNPWGFADPALIPVAQISSLFAEVDILRWTTPARQVPSSPPHIHITSTPTGLSSVVDGTSYTGPVQGIASQYDASANVAGLAISADTPSWFIHGGSGNDAIAVTGGTNVLDGGAGSNFLVGASGADGGADTFFTDARGSDVVWSTLVNFHGGDYSTLWGFDPNVSTWYWDGISGCQNYTGATLRADVHGTGTIDASITFAGLTMDQAQKLEVSSGSAGGNGYLLLHNPGI